MIICGLKLTLLTENLFFVVICRGLSETTNLWYLDDIFTIFGCVVSDIVDTTTMDSEP